MDVPDVFEGSLMESTTYDVRDTRPGHVQDETTRTEHLDGLPLLAPMPQSIKAQMPNLAAMLQDLATKLPGGRDDVALQVRATVDLRTAYAADDFSAVSAVYRRGHGWVYWEEAGCCFGVPEVHMRAFASRHRNARRSR